MAATLGLICRHLGSEDQFTYQTAAIRLTEGEAEDVRRLVVLEVPGIELMDSRVVHEGEADFRVVDALGLEHAPNELAHAAAINRHLFLRAGYGDADHVPLAVRAPPPPRAWPARSE